MKKLIFLTMVFGLFFIAANNVSAQKDKISLIRKNFSGDWISKDTRMTVTKDTISIRFSDGKVITGKYRWNAAWFLDFTLSDGQEERIMVGMTDDAKTMLWTPLKSGIKITYKRP
jgi:hypothetical protein